MNELVRFLRFNFYLPKTSRDTAISVTHSAFRSDAIASYRLDDWANSGDLACQSKLTVQRSALDMEVSDFAPSLTSSLPPGAATLSDGPLRKPNGRSRYSSPRCRKMHSLIFQMYFGGKDVVRLRLVFEA